MLSDSSKADGYNTSVAEGMLVELLVSRVFGLLNSKLFHGTSASMRFALGIMGYLEFMNIITAHERGASTSGLNHWQEIKPNHATPIECQSSKGCGKK